MKTISRVLINISSEKIPESKEFYTKLFDFTINFDSDWFVHLVSEENGFELGIIKSDHEIVPKGIKQSSQGMYVTFVVASADEIFEFAKSNNFEIVKEPANTFYGQRRLLLKDPY